MRIFFIDEFRARRRERRLLLTSVLIGLVAGGCFDLDLDFDSDDPGNDAGCQMGTPGELQRVVFKFSQDGIQNLSAGEGAAFAAGTNTRFWVAPLGNEELPPLSVATSDGEVLTVLEDGPPEEPYLIAFHQVGSASVRLTRADDSTVYDELSLRVAEPVAITVVADHSQSAELDVSQQFVSPQRVFLAPGASCRLYLHLLDQSGNALYGLYTEQVSTTSIVEYRVGSAIAIDAFTLTGLSRELEALSEGAETLVLSGPRDATGILAVEVTTVPELERLSVSVDLFSGDDMVPGTRLKAFAVGVTPQGDPAYGYDMIWESDNPAVAVVVPGTGSPDTAYVDLYERGRATFTARWREDQTVLGAVELTVEDGL